MSNAGQQSGMIDQVFWPVMFETEWEANADFAGMNQELEFAALSSGSPDLMQMLLRDNLESHADQLPITTAFARQYGTREFGYRNYDFSFIARSLIPQPAVAELHVDANSDSGIGDWQTSVRSWRMLINLSDEYPRGMKWSFENTARMQKTKLGGYLACSGFDPSMLATISLKPRQGRLVNGVVFCASEVAHSGSDGPHGRFTASYGYEEIVP